MFLSFLLQVLWHKFLLLTCETEALGFPGTVQVAWAVWKWELDPSPWLLQPGEPWCGLPALLDMAIKMSQRVGLGQVYWWVVMEHTSKVCLMGRTKPVEMRNKRNTKSTLWLQKWRCWHVWLVCNTPCAETEHSTSQPEKNCFTGCKKNQYGSTMFF